ASLRFDTDPSLTRPRRASGSRPVVTRAGASTETPMLAINSLRARYERGASFEQFVADAVANVELWHALARRAETPDSVVREIEAVGGAWHLLVLTEDWCGDAVNTLPVLAAISNRARNLDLRILSRDANLELMDAHLTGRSRSI